MRRWVTIGEAAGLACVSKERMREWCALGWVWCRRLANGRSRWLVRLDDDGLPSDPPTHERPPARRAGRARARHASRRSRKRHRDMPRCS